TSIIELSNAGGAEPHRSGSVEENQQLGIRLTLIALQKTAVSPREDIPVDMPKIVPLGISAVFSELLRKSEVRRPVKPRNEPIDNSLSHQIKAGNRSE